MTTQLDRLAAALEGRYRVERELGAGGMATVYLAEDLRHHRLVAIKVLREELAASVGTARFLREIEIAAGLQHPNILPMLDSGAADGVLFYVMPFVDGQSLRQRLATEGELPAPEAVRLLTELADALAYAHQRGVVHRDIKPDNVMLSGRHALVTDFGVARAVNAATGSHDVTSIGIALGTPAYMAPEQATADPAIDQRADLYALGAVGYELLTGRPPFVRDTPQQVLAAHVTEAPEPLARHRPGLPAALESVIMKCLEKRPADRCQSAQDLLASLEPLATPGSGSTPAGKAPPGRSDDRRWLGGVVAAVLLAVAIIAWQALLGRRTNDPPALSIGQSQQLTDNDGLELFPAISPDGKFVAYAGGTYARLRIFIRPVVGGRTLALSDDTTAIETQPRWSPDGNHVLFLSRGAIWIAPSLGGEARRLTRETTARDSVLSAVWSPDGREIAASRGDTLVIVPSDGGAERVVASAPSLHSCVWSPDGERIACVSGNANYVAPGVLFGNMAPATLVTIAVDGGKIDSLTDHSEFVGSPAWSADGRRLYFVSDRNGPRDVFVMDATPGSVRRIIRRITTGLNVQTFVLAADERRIAYSVYTARSNMYSLPIPTRGAVSSRAATALTSGNQVIEAMRTSRDGKWIIFDSNREGGFDVYRMPVEGGDAENLTREPGDEFQPDLSPDGREIAFHSWRTGSRDVFVKPLDGGPAVQVTRSDAHEAGPAWSPDGNSIAFWMIGGDRTIHVVRRDSSGGWNTPSNLGPTRSRPDWLPDGTGLTYSSEFRLAVVSPDGGSVRIVYAPASPSDPVVGLTQVDPDGRTVYFKSSDAQGRSSIWSVPLSGGRPRLLVSFDDVTRPSIRTDFATDGKRFYFALDERQSDIWVAEIAGAETARRP